MVVSETNRIESSIMKTWNLFIDPIDSQKHLQRTNNQSVHSVFSKNRKIPRDGCICKGSQDVIQRTSQEKNRTSLA